MSEPVYKIGKLFPRGIIPLGHALCGVHLCSIKNCDKTEILSTFQQVVRHLIAQGYRCPRCKKALSQASDIIPLWAPPDEGVQPIAAPDESGHLQFGAEFGDPAVVVEPSPAFEPSPTA